MASEKILHAYDNGILPDHSFAYGGDRRRRFPSNSFWPKGPYIIAALSLLFNLYSVFNQMYLSTEVLYSHRSRYANLRRDVLIEWTHDSEFNSRNRTVLDNAWKSLDENIGIVALGDAFVANKELLVAQRWPWDDSKGLYILQSHHSLHCLNILRNSLLEFHDDTRQSRDFGHVMHCLDSFRQEIVCNADDTPRYTGFSKDHTSGLGQARMCRDWGQLERWAKGHSACYRYDASADNSDGVDLSQFRHCPDGSRPWDRWSQEPKT